MAKNILLLFLSDVKIRAGVISEVRYENVDGEKTQTTNESAIRYLLKEFPLDKIFIFASNRVRGEMTGYLADDGKPQTHLQFSLERFKKFLPTAEYLVFDYDEYGTDDDNLKSIAKMAEHVQKFAVGEKVTLHVDLTGGLRHVNMMLLELTRLLEYSGLTVGKVLYSNYKGANTPGTVEEIQNVYDLFQLIAGVEEFVNFGSVKALNFYYASKKISEPLKNLRGAMENFAEAVKLCHYEQFSDAIIKLHDAVHDFGKHESADVEDVLMARLIGRIREDYHRLIVNRELDDLEVIRWCLEKGYVQQALMLYTERIPEYLGKKKIVTQRADERRKLIAACGDDVRSKNFYLLNVYKSNVQKSDDRDFNTMWLTIDKELSKAKSDYCKLIKGIPDATREGLDFDEWYEKISALAEKICAKVKLIYPTAPLEKEHIICEDVEKLRAQYEILLRLRTEPQLSDNLSADEFAPLKTFLDTLQDKFAAGKNKRKVIFNALAQIKGDDVKKFFPMLTSRRNAQIFRLKQMFDAQIFSLKDPFDEKIFFNVMEKYFRIKNERNRAAHAHEDSGEFKTAESIRRFMLDALKEIEDNLLA